MPYNDFEEKVFQLTPSRRATINPAITLATTLFQLTPSRRATSTLPSSSVIPVFQLTPSRRATTLRKSGAWNCEDFNSRPHGGRRSGTVEVCVGGEFQLTPSRRATSCAGVYGAMRCLFQLTPSRRATAVWFDLLFAFAHFNSRPHGGRLSGQTVTGGSGNFNSRPHGGRQN